MNSKEPTIGPYPEPNELSSYPHALIAITSIFWFPKLFFEFLYTICWVIHRTHLLTLHLIIIWRLSQRRRGLRHEMSSPVQTTGSWVHIPLEIKMSAFLMLSCVGTGLVTGLISPPRSPNACLQDQWVHITFDGNKTEGLICQCRRIKTTEFGED
jgi:hypothetical protein